MTLSPHDVQRRDELRKLLSELTQLWGRRYRCLVDEFEASLRASTIPKSTHVSYSKVSVLESELLESLRVR